MNKAFFTVFAVTIDNEWIKWCYVQYYSPSLWRLLYASLTNISYGKPGVQLTACHQDETRIQELHFLPEQVRTPCTSIF